MDPVFFSSLRSATGIYDAWSQCIFSPGNTRHSFCLLAPSLFLYVQTHSHTNIHAHNFPGIHHILLSLKVLFHLISSNRQRCGSGAGWSVKKNTKTPWLNIGANALPRVHRGFDYFCPSNIQDKLCYIPLFTGLFVVKWQWSSIKWDCFTHIFGCEAHIHTRTRQFFFFTNGALYCCLRNWQLPLGQAQHSCQSSIFDFSHTLLVFCSTLISVNKLYLNVCLCLSVRLCVSSHSHEAFLWKRAHRWWRVYWLVGQAPSVSTRLKGDSSRPSYWHAELICSFWSITANWNYHCPASHVSGPFVWFILVLSALACLWKKGWFISVWQESETCLPFHGQKWRRFSVEMLYLCGINHDLIAQCCDKLI